MRQVLPRKVCANIWRAWRQRRTTGRAGTPPACAAPSSSARRASAGTPLPPPSRCAVRTTAVVPSYSSSASLTMSPRSRSRASSASAGYGVGCWMYGQSTCSRANVEVGLDRLRACRPGCRRSARRRRTCRCRCRCSIASSAALPTGAAAFALGVLRARPQEVEVVGQHVLDAEEHVAEPGAAHQRRQRRRRAARSPRSSPCTT